MTGLPGVTSLAGGVTSLAAFQNGIPEWNFRMEVHSRMEVQNGSLEWNFRMEVHSRVEFQNGSAFQNGNSEWKCIPEWNFRMEVHSRVEYLRGTKWPLRASVSMITCMQP